MTAVALEVDGRIATITLTPRDGLIDAACSDALAEAAAAVAADVETVRALVVRGGGPDFAHGWAGDALALDDTADGRERLARGIDALAAVPQPVVAALHGRVESAGLEIALACDVRVAAAGATFAMPETALGVVPRAGGTQRLPRAVGRAHALRLLLLGETIDAGEARRIGLVSAVVPDDAVATAARAQADVIASRGPIATRLAKEAVHRGVEMPLDQALRYELDLTVLLQSTADRAEGVRAFAARRPPEFHGR